MSELSVSERLRQDTPPAVLEWNDIMNEVIRDRQNEAVRSIAYDGIHPTSFFLETSCGSVVRHHSSKPEHFWVKFRSEDVRAWHFIPGTLKLASGWIESTKFSWNYLFNFRDSFIQSIFTRSQVKIYKRRHRNRTKRLMNELLLFFARKKHKQIYKNILEELGLIPGIGLEYKVIQERFNTHNY